MGVGKTIAYLKAQEENKKANEAALAKLNADALLPGYVPPPSSPNQPSKAERFAPSPIGKTAAQYLSGKSAFKFENFRPEIQAQIIGATKDPNERARLESISAQSPYHEIRRRTAETQATSEAIKQAEQRAIASSQGVTLGSINSAVKSSSELASIFNPLPTPSPTEHKNVTRELSAREQAELITQGKASPFYIGQSSVESKKQIETSTKQQQGIQQQAKFPAIYSDKKGKELFTITGQSKGSEFNYYVQDKDKEDYFSNLFKAGKESKVDANNIFPFPLESKNKEPKYPLGLAAFNTFKDVLAGSILQSSPTPPFLSGFDKIVFPLLGKGYSPINEPKVERAAARINKAVGAGEPGLAGASIQQLAEFKPLTGTGRGLAYDIESGLATLATIFIPVGKKPFSAPSFKSTVDGGRVETISQTFKIFGKDIVTKNVGGYNLGGPLRKLERSNLGKIEPVAGTSATGQPQIGFEFSTQGKYAENILTSQKGFDILKQAGKISDREIRLALGQKEAVKIVKFAEKKIPDVERKQAITTPKQPLSSLLPGSESNALNIDIFGTSKVPFKGSLAETMQLSEKILKKRKPRGSEPSGSLEGLDIRDVTTADADLEYVTKKFGLPAAEKTAEIYKNILQKAAGPGRTFEKIGTNVIVKEKGKKVGSPINIVTERDANAGYLNSLSGKIFGQDLGRKVLKFDIKGTKRKAPFISLESQTMRRIEASTMLHGPKTEKFRGAGQPDYLLPGFEIKYTSKGYRFGPVEHGLKHIVKNVENFDQIADNLDKYLYTGKAKRLREIAEQTRKDYPELDFGLDIPEKVEPVYDFPSLASSIGSKAKKPLKSGGIGTSIALGRIQPTKETKEISKSLKELSKERKNQSSLSKLIDESFTSKPSRIGSRTNYLNSDYLSKLGSGSRAGQSSRGSIVDLNIGELSSIGPSVKSSGGSFPKIRIQSAASVLSPSSKASSKSLSIISDISLPSILGSPTSKPSTTSPGRSFPSFPSSSPGKTPGKPPGGSSSSFGSFPNWDLVPPPIKEFNFRFPKIKLGYEGRRKRKPATYMRDVLFIGGPADIMRSGVIAAASGRYTTVAEQRGRVGTTVFKNIDKLLGKARKRKSATKPLTF